MYVEDGSGSSVGVAVGVGVPPVTGVLGVGSGVGVEMGIGVGLGVGVAVGNRKIVGVGVGVDSNRGVGVAVGMGIGTSSDGGVAVDLAMVTGCETGVGVVVRNSIGGRSSSWRHPAANNPTSAKTNKPSATGNLEHKGFLTPLRPGIVGPISQFTASFTISCLLLVVSLFQHFFVNSKVMGYFMQYRNTNLVHQFYLSVTGCLQ